MITKELDPMAQTHVPYEIVKRRYLWNIGMHHEQQYITRYSHSLLQNRFNYLSYIKPVRCRRLSQGTSTRAEIEPYKVQLTSSGSRLRR